MSYVLCTQITIQLESLPQGWVSVPSRNNATASTTQTISNKGGQEILKVANPKDNTVANQFDIAETIHTTACVSSSISNINSNSNCNSNSNSNSSINSSSSSNSGCSSNGSSCSNSSSNSSGSSGGGNSQDISTLSNGYLDSNDTRTQAVQYCD